MKNKKSFLWQFTFVNKFTLVTTPYVITVASTLQEATKNVRRIFEPSMYDVQTSVCIKRRGAIVISEYTLYDCEL